MVYFGQLPPSLQLTSMHFSWCGVQLQPGKGSQGVLGGAAGLAALKHFGLQGCGLLDGSADEALSTALSQLPAGLEHLGMDCTQVEGGLPTAGLQRLQQLTYLSLKGFGLQGPDAATPVLQPLKDLTRLVDLRLDFW